MFQSLIISQFIARQNQDALQSAYADFTAHFHNADIQTNIKNSKEEQYQEGFLKDLFVNILGYTLNPQPNFNLTTELKNQKGSKKCDGAIIKDDHAICVIELKGMDTTDLDRIEEQAFGYKNNQPNCRYVITANFQKLRFYIDNSVEHLEFDLFNLSYDKFSLLYTLLHRDNLLTDTPLKLKQASISQEEKITKQLYQDYSAFKRALFADLIASNSQIDQLTLFNKTQKLLDRLLFIFFAEDRQLLPANTAHKMIKEWQQAKALNIPMSVYSHLKNYFNYLNTGYKSDSVEIFAYNGGLFKPDEILDNLIISDNVLYEHITRLADYDFNSEIDVNILGHIFENSLNEIDEIKAKIAGETLDKSQTKRKKDGVFYTPKYITSYIVQNTVGKLCAEKRAEFGVIDDEYHPNRQKKTQEKLYQNLQDYRAWLLDLTICDPACGSGAFLNEALNFLINEHGYIHELECKLTGSNLLPPQISNHILENNLYGVDINAESVEIAKLSLWLRTAEPHRKLSNLSQNIKCGNSLIDDESVAGDKAFDWAKEFPQVFERGGFDVVIGNPPWGAKVDKNQKDFINNKYISKKGELETYIHFIDLAINYLIKHGGILGYITPNTWYYLDKYYDIRNLLINFNIYELIELEKNIFEDAPDIIPAIFLIKKSKSDIGKIRTLSLKKGIKPLDINNDDFELNEIYIGNISAFENLSFNLKLNTPTKEVLLKIMHNCKLLSRFYNVRYGIKTGNNAKYISKNNPTPEWKKCISSASGVKRYNLVWEGDFLHYGKHLSGYSENSFEVPKILIQYIRKLSMDIRLVTAFDEKGVYYPLNNFSFIEQRNEKYSLYFLQCLMNSKLFNFYFKNVFIDYNIKPKYIEKLPIPEIPLSEQQPFIAKAEQMLSLNQTLQETVDKFLRTLNRKFDLSDFSKNLQSWYSLSYKDFVKELAKKKIKLSLGDEAEWEDYFIAEQTKAQSLQNQIAQTDHAINQMVYELYGLNDDEIAVVEG